MSEPRRLLKGGGSDFERMLVRSAQKDAPSRELRGKTLAALGLGAGVAGASATAAAATAAKTAAKAGLLKWIGFGVVSGVVVVAAAGLGPQISASPERPRALVATEAPPEPSAAEQPASPALLAEQEPAPPPAEQMDTAEPSSGKHVEPARPRASAEPSLSAFAEEVASLDVAREALAAGNAARAIQALDQHDRAYPRALFSQEATILRIEALAQRGDHASASRLGAAFLAAHPRSPSASRVRSLIGKPFGSDSAGPSP